MHFSLCSRLDVQPDIQMTKRVRCRRVGLFLRLPMPRAFEPSGSVIRATRNTAHIVTNEVTLPDRLLEYMAEYQYISGEFRRRFEFEQPLATGDIQLPRTAAVLRTAARLPDIRAFGAVIEEAIMDKDRFKITPIEGMPQGSMGFSYYAWRNSPYLIDRFFSEWKLGLFLAVQQGEFVFMHDTEGLVVDMCGLGLKRAGRSVMEKAFPEGEDIPSRLSRMSFSSLDMSQHAVRAMALRTRSFADAFTDLLDPSLVPATAAGFVNGTARYVGFSRWRPTWRRLSRPSNRLRQEGVCEDQDARQSGRRRLSEVRNRTATPWRRPQPSVEISQDRGDRRATGSPRKRPPKSRRARAAK